MRTTRQLVWNEKWRLAALSRSDLVTASLAAVVVSLVFLLFHALGVTTEAHRFGRSVFLWMISHWQTSGPTLGTATDYSHGWLIPIASGAIIWYRRRELMAAPRSVSKWGLAVVIGALLLHWMGARAQLPRLSLFGLVGLTWGIPFYLFGWSFARILIFPCAYLIFCIPLNFLDSLTLPLRVYMTAATHFILNGLGFHIVQSGTALHSVVSLNVPVLLHPDNIKYSLEIADPCSGIRSLIAMVAITAIYAYLTQRTLLKKWLLFLAAVPLALVGNTVRILTIALVSEALGQRIGAGLYHDFSGYLIFMAITIPLMIFLGNILDADVKESWQRWKRALLNTSSS
jgi:exosortase